jgi:hypothetical protein
MSDDPVLVDIRDGDWHFRPVAVIDNEAHGRILSGFVLEGPVKAPLFLRLENGEGTKSTITLTWYSLVAVVRVLVKLLDYAEFQEETP